ncbi:MAG TPA: hypothetical protein VEC11_13600 [Allosphingosinicella sp.]|nr:hypothetical protein [Allosphingosinicella sp.]
MFRLLSRFGPWVLLAAFLFVTGLVLALLGLLLGFDLGDVDAWLEAQGGVLNAVGVLLLRILCGIVLLLCVLALVAPFFWRKDKDADRPGWGCALLAIPVGWFAWVGMTMSY